jgi:hypothetical protein
MRRHTLWLACLAHILGMCLPLESRAQVKSTMEQNTRIHFGFFNDNYTGDMKHGVSGRYFGPDDFLTFTLYGEVEKGPWQSSLVYNMITSRVGQFRSDHITSHFSRLFSMGEFEIHPGLGLVLRGNFEGQKLQNWFHEITHVPPLSLPYTKVGAGLIFSTTIQSWIMSQPAQYGEILATLELRVATAIVPSRVTPLLTYQSKWFWQRVRIGVRGGARIYLNETDSYSFMVRQGPIGGINIEGRILDHLSIWFGVTMFPGKNLGVDPAYKYKEYNYLPQICTTISWNIGDKPIQELLKY